LEAKNENENWLQLHESLDCFKQTSHFNALYCIFKGTVLLKSSRYDETEDDSGDDVGNFGTRIESCDCGDCGCINSGSALM
jgi:hypothetical protein